MPHLSQQPQAACLETNFRLLRHDVVGPLSLALQQLMSMGGLAGLQQQQQQQVRRRSKRGASRLTECSHTGMLSSNSLAYPSLFRWPWRRQPCLPAPPALLYPPSSCPPPLRSVPLAGWS